MCIGSISDFIDGFHGCVDGSIITNGGIGAPKIIIDSTWAAHTRNAKLFFENHGAGIGSISTDTNDAFDT